ncbi:MAG TPA: hypothetical protein PKD23_00130 [Bellilinea sp.]|nr:hypothetical protein [Bellilinea sp.]
MNKGLNQFGRVEGTAFNPAAEKSTNVQGFWMIGYFTGGVIRGSSVIGVKSAGF